MRGLWWVWTCRRCGGLLTIDRRRVWPPASPAHQRRSARPARLRRGRGPRRRRGWQRGIGEHLSAATRRPPRPCLSPPSRPPRPATSSAPAAAFAIFQAMQGNGSGVAEMGGGAGGGGRKERGMGAAGGVLRLGDARRCDQRRPRRRSAGIGDRDGGRDRDGNGDGDGNGDRDG